MSENITHKSRLWTEENITNIIKHICDNHSYVILVNDEGAEFIIEGYYFKVSGNVKDKWAIIEIDNATKEIKWDNEAESCVKILGSKPDLSDSQHALQLSDDNKYRFKATSGSVEAATYTIIKSKPLE